MLMFFEDGMIHSNGLVSALHRVWECTTLFAAMHAAQFEDPFHDDWTYWPRPEF